MPRRQVLNEGTRVCKTEREPQLNYSIVCTQPCGQDLFSHNQKDLQMKGV